MDKAEKKRRRAEFKRMEREALRASIPMALDALKNLFRHVARNSAPPCDHTLKDGLHYLKTHNLDAGTIVPWLHEHGAVAPFVRPTPQSDPWRRDRARIVW
jgi:hypothetical protein